MSWLWCTSWDGNSTSNNRNDEEGNLNVEFFLLILHGINKKFNFRKLSKFKLKSLFGQKHSAYKFRARENQSEKSYNIELVLYKRLNYFFSSFFSILITGLYTIIFRSVWRKKQRKKFLFFYLIRTYNFQWNHLYKNFVLFFRWLSVSG